MIFFIILSAIVPYLIVRLPRYLDKKWQEDAKNYIQEPLTFRPYHKIVLLLHAVCAIIIATLCTNPFVILFYWNLCILSAIDAKHHILPDELTIGGLWLGLVYHLHMGDPLTEYIYGAIVGYCIFAGLSMSYKWIRATEGLGLGDAKLLALLLAWCGLSALGSIILLSSLLALTGVGILALFKRYAGGYFAYGPYLALAGGIIFYHTGKNICLWLP